MPIDQSNDHKVSTQPPWYRVINIGSLCRKIDPEMDYWQVCYQFRGGHDRVDTDRTTNGFYRTP